MGQRRSKGVSIQDLGDTRSRLHGLHLFTPVSGGQRVFESVGDGVGLDRNREDKVLVGINTLSSVANHDPTC